MRLKYWFIPLLLAALWFGQAMLAQVAPNTIEMVGAIEAINADGSVVVNGQTILLTGAQLNVTLTVGQVVKIEGALQEDGSIAAGEVNAPQSGDLLNDEIELTGVVDSFDGITLVVGGLVIDLTAAELHPPIVVGQRVKVHASFDTNGDLVAREAGVADDSTSDDTLPSSEATPEVGQGADQSFDDNGAGEFEIVGTLESIGDGFIVVNGQTIDVTGAEIKDTLVVGTLVKLHLRVQDNQQVAAREVENTRDRNRNNDDTPSPESTPEVGFNDDNFGSDSSNSGSGNSDSGWEHTYTIRAGDTLSSIAARAGTTVQELARVNNITNVQVVIVGTRILVPYEIHPVSSDDQQANSNSGSGSLDSSSFDDSSTHDQFDDHSSDDSSHDSNDDSSSNSGHSSDDHEDDHSGSSGSDSSHDDDD